MNVQKLLNPKSIAIIGVSENLNKLNGRILKLLVEKIMMVKFITY